MSTYFRRDCDKFTHTSGPDWNLCVPADLPAQGIEWVELCYSWASRYFGPMWQDDYSGLFVAFVVAAAKLDDWEYVWRNDLSDVADRLGFHGGLIHSRTDLATAPTPI